ncbi:exodeoxyribonuclease VII large subunit [Engelhardtia mirabilis]|uniref:Exodeoxyribonuclease 7 large subunit n=1 Tax=Engelhardtia mirabilis TaxID=2528011 RepID=A0A518BM19_9BACT|nr:Exodeoxyribonuclease 7 large subunit [Planctomycetes bacterium Pla133]QDV02350.1 Exodeoxyribonuclease 7 large subunit [Planctomycetes bacterium Pla86]
MRGLFEEPPSRTGAGASELEDAAESVTELTRRIAAQLQGFGRVRVEGELSGLKKAASGHVYFDLKDAGARISCVVWRSHVARVGRLNPREGDRVVAHGTVDVYAPRGSYSLVVDRLEPVGVGQLLARLEALKAELRERGWFGRARALPTSPRLIGVVTSRDGAALRDILRTRSLRWSGHPLRLCHTPVQGPGAAEQVAAAIARLDASGVDVIIVARGGGSLEDLWAFNEEPVARAIWECSVPVVSGVGHETDTTLADLVADHRAHTPTDAAQTVIPDRAAREERLERLWNHLLEAMDELVEARADRLARASGSRVLRGAEWILADRARELRHLLARLHSASARDLGRAGERLGSLANRLGRVSPRARVELWERRLSALAPRLEGGARTTLERADRRLALAAGTLDAISPLKVLARGYSITNDAAGVAVRDGSDLSVGDELETRFARGSARSRVFAVDPGSERSE